MATKKPTVQDFDNWTEEDERRAIQQAAANVKVRHIIKGNEFWALTPSGNIYKLPLLLSIRDFDALSSAADDSESVQQVKRIIKAFAGPAQAQLLEGEPIQVAVNMLQDYGATLTRTQGVDLGKSADSAGGSSPRTE